MKSDMRMLVILSCLAIVGFKPSSGTRLMVNDVSIGRKIAPAFDAKLNSFSESAGVSSLKVQAKKTAVSFEEFEMKPRSDSSKNAANEKKGLTFKKNRADGGAKELAKDEEVIYSVFPMERVRPSAWIYRGNKVVNVGRLSRSKHIPRGGQKKIYRASNSTWRRALAQMQKRILGSSPRIQGSSPSPGGGN